MCGRGELAVPPHFVGTRADLADVFALHAAGRTKVIAQARDLHEVNMCIDQVLAGEVPARLVFTF